MYCLSVVWLSISPQRIAGTMRFALNTPIFCPIQGFSNNSFIIDILCRVALSTVVPSISTGSNTAVGVNTPVLPIVYSIFFNVVSTESFLTLKAIPFLKWWLVLPRDLPYCTSSNLKTTPSCGRHSCSAMSNILSITT